MAEVPDRSRMFELLEEADRLTEDVGYWSKLPYKIEEPIFNNRKFRIEWYNPCHLLKVVFRWMNDREFYRWERNLERLSECEEDDLVRKEFFQSRQFREYVGRQNCFLEFCDELFLRGGNLLFPREEKLYSAAGSLGLDEAVAKIYIGFFKKFFNTKKRGDIKKRGFI